MGWQATVRAMEAAERRQQREALKRHRELERQAKEQAKLSAIEKARWEVATYENRIELLLSVHKEQGQSWDWPAVAASLPPPIPKYHTYRELVALQQACLTVPGQVSGTDSAVTQARLRDQQEYEQALRNHATETADLEKLKALARRILAGDPKAYTEALVELSPLGEISVLGSAIHFTVHDPRLLEAVLKVNGVQAIPAEVKSLTASGKLSVRPMPKARFHELYQDYICSCILRVAREVFALLPVTTVLLTAAVDGTGPSKSGHKEQSVLSTVVTRASLAGLDFERLDPSDAMEQFLHRGDFRASRKAGAFAPITPFTPADVPRPPTRVVAHEDTLAKVRRLRADLSAELAALSPSPPLPIP